MQGTQGVSRGAQNGQGVQGVHRGCTAGMQGVCSKVCGFGACRGTQANPAHPAMLNRVCTGGMQHKGCTGFILGTACGVYRWACRVCSQPSAWKPLGFPHGSLRPCMQIGLSPTNEHLK